MSSPLTHDEMATYLTEQENFGVPAEDVQLFCQGTMPAVDLQTGKILLAARDEIALSPNGHGGLLQAFAEHGCLEDCARRGISQLFYFQVDNPLCTVCDPEFIGYHLLSQSQYSCQVVAKQEALDRVGNVVECDDRLRIIEYSDLPEEAARRTTPAGELALWAGSIAVHMFEVAFLKEMANRVDALPFHYANKRVPFMDERGEMVEPTELNGLKFEQFIFDLLPLAERGLAMEVDAAVAFAPLKNASGAPKDTPESIQAQWSALHRQWLTAAGIDVAPNVTVEISPLWALDAGQVAERAGGLPKTIRQDTYIN